MSFLDVMEHVAQLFEAIGALILLGGLLVALGLAGRSWRRGRDGGEAYRVLRRSFGAAILLGLEVLVAADLVRTVAVAPTLENVLNLAVIVVIRTFLSFSLEIEIEGVPPWRRALVRPGRGPAPTAARDPAPAPDGDVPTARRSPGRARSARR